MNPNESLKKLGIELPAAPTPIAAYVPTKIVGNLVFCSGQGPILNGKQMFTGKVGTDLTLEEGQQAARICALNLLAQLKNQLGDLNRVKQIVHLKGFVASASDFYQQPQVMNGASELFIEVFGEAGRHSRCAYGTNVLPTNIPVEVELVVEFE